MLCQTAQEYFHDLADTRPIARATSDELNRHLTVCMSCQREMSLIRTTKSFLSSKKLTTNIPISTAQKILQSLTLEAENATTCFEVNSYINDIVDSRPLPDALYDRITDHLLICDRCGKNLETTRATKSLLFTRMAAAKLPNTTMQSIRNAIALEASNEDTISRIRSPLPQFGVFRRNPIAALGLIAAAVILFIIFSPKRDPEQIFNEGPNAFVNRNFALFESLNTGSTTLQCSTNDERDLKTFFLNQGVSAELDIPKIATASIIGGFVTHPGTTPIAHIVYLRGSKKICVCEMSIADAIKANKMDISDSARRCFSNGMMYWFCDGKHNHSVGMWKNHETVCAITSDYSPQDITALFTPKKQQ